MDILIVTLVWALFVFPVCLIVAYLVSDRRSVTPDELADRIREGERYRVRLPDAVEEE